MKNRRHGPANGDEPGPTSRRNSNQDNAFAPEDQAIQVKAMDVLIRAGAGRRMNQGDIGLAADVSPTSMSKIVQGKQRVFFYQVVKMARAVGASLDEMAGASGGRRDEPAVTPDERAMLTMIRAMGLTPADVLQATGQAIRGRTAGGGGPLRPLGPDVDLIDRDRGRDHDESRARSVIR